MSLAILGLTAGFILVLVFLLYLLIHSQLTVFMKFLAVFIVAGFYILQYESLQQYSGWPSTDDLPEKFVLIATDIREPNQKTGEKGMMYWWLRDSASLDQAPRVYQLPYEPEVHKKTEQVLQQQEMGTQYVGRKSKKSQLTNGAGVSFEKISKSQRHQKARKGNGS